MKKTKKSTTTKKAQMPMGETIMVLFAFFVLLGIGLVLYAQYQKSSMQREAAESFEREAVRIALKVAFYPELACSEAGVINENCFDLHKAVAFAEKVKQSTPVNEEFFLFYETELRDSTVYIEQIFPEADAMNIQFEQTTDTEGRTRLNKITLYDNKPNFEEEESWEKVPTFIPITLRDDTKQKIKRDALGMLVVETYRIRFG